MMWMDWEPLGVQRLFWTMKGPSLDEDREFAYQWLNKVVESYVREDTKFLKVPGEKEGWSPTFGDSELQMASALQPALRANADLVYTEVRYFQKVGKKRRKRRMDYWAYDGKRSFGIEYKDGWVRIKKGKEGDWKPRDGIQGPWEQVVRQANRPSDWMLGPGKPRYKVALFILRLFKREAESRLTSRGIMSFCRECIQVLGEGKVKGPDWAAVWIADKRARASGRWRESGGKPLVPVAAGFFAKVGIRKPED